MKLHKVVHSNDDTTGTDVAEEHVTLVTEDQHTINGTLFHKTKAHLTAAAVFNCGAGLSARHYRRFARHLAANNVAILTYDYRGIGQSRHGSLRGFHATFEDWAEHDCSSAIELVLTRFGLPTFGISHSIGALIFGGATNATNLAGLVMIGPHTGYVGDYRRAYRLPMGILWHAVMPCLTTIVGYFPGRRLGLGEDIPRGVAMAWARRRRPQPAMTLGSRTSQLTDRMASISSPALAITASDDGFATPAGAARVDSLFRNATLERVVVTPQQASMPQIGHFGFFRAPQLWPLVLSFVTSGTRDTRSGNPDAAIDLERPEAAGSNLLKPDKAALPHIKK